MSSTCTASGALLNAVTQSCFSGPLLCQPFICLHDLRVGYVQALLRASWSKAFASEMLLDLALFCPILVDV